MGKIEKGLPAGGPFSTPVRRLKGSSARGDVQAFVFCAGFFPYETKSGRAASIFIGRGSARETPVTDGRFMDSGQGEKRLKKRRYGLRLSRWLILLLAMSLILASCSSGSGGSAQGGEPTTIKVMYWHEQSFQQEYGMLFYAFHPNIEVEVVNTNAIQATGDDYEEKWDEFIRNEKPDILLLNQQQYEEFVADGRLVSLESYIARDKFELEGLLPGMVDLLREKGDGELYGLTPYFYSQAIFYNKDLFDRFGVEYPTDRMSWEELLNLAARFPTDGSDEDRIYGLHLGTSDVQNLAHMIGLAQGLRLVNPADKRVSLDTDSWVRAYETALNAIRSGTIYKEENFEFSGSMRYEDFLLRDPFIKGKVAMSVGQTYLLQQIREAANVVPDKAVKNWDLVTMPVDPANPDISNHISFYEIFAINAESANRDAAWAFIKYIHSDDFARVKAKTLTGQLPVRTKYIRDNEGRNIGAFYALKPSGADLYSGLLNDLPNNFFMQFSVISQEEMQAVLDDRKTVKEALASMQARLQAALDEALANKDQGGDAADPPVSFEPEVMVGGAASDNPDATGETDSDANADGEGAAE